MTTPPPRTRVRVRPTPPTNDNLVAAAVTAVRHTVINVAPSTLKRLKDRSRTTPRRKVDAMVAMITQFRVITPLLVDETGTVIAGDARLQAALRMGLSEVPTISVTHLTEPERRAFIIADNNISQLSVWDDETLRNELKFLAGLDLTFSLELTGFTTPEIETRIAIGEDQAADDTDDVGLVAPTPEARPVTRRGDVWQTADRRIQIICGDSQAAATYEALLGPVLADLVATDAPYNLKVAGIRRRQGKTGLKQWQPSGSARQEGAWIVLIRAYQSFHAVEVLIRRSSDWPRRSRSDILNTLASGGHLTNHCKACLKADTAKVANGCEADIDLPLRSSNVAA